MVEELTYTKRFIKGYALFTIVMIVFKITGAISVFPELPRLTTISLQGILNFVGSIFGFLISLIFYSIPEYVILNYILWILRVISFLEILLYAKKLIHPTQV